MVSSKASTVKAYLSSLPADRKKTVEAIRKVVKRSLPRGYVEQMQYGMICWVVPLSRYPEPYNGQPLAIASLASQKNHLSLYLHGVYADPAVARRFETKWRASGKKLNMGKSCVRFRDAEDVALDAVAEAVAALSVEDYVAIHERVHARRKRRRKITTKTRLAAAKKTSAKKKPAKKKPAKKKSAAKKPAKGKSAAKKPAKKKSAGGKSAPKRKSPATKRPPAKKSAKR